MENAFWASSIRHTRAQWDAGMSPELAGLLDGLHFHTLCEQGSDALEITLNAVAERFGDVLPRMKILAYHVPRKTGGAAQTDGAGQFPRPFRAVQRRTR